MCHFLNSYKYCTAYHWSNLYLLLTLSIVLLSSVSLAISSPDCRL